MSFTLEQKLNSFLDRMPTLDKTEEGTMVSITIGFEDKFCPELFQVIDKFDGTYTCQHLASIRDGNGHATIFSEIVSLEDRDNIVKSAMSMPHKQIELFHGDQLLESYRFVNKKR